MLSLFGLGAYNVHMVASPHCPSDCRGAAVDVHLDHQSISRQHAAVCYQRITGKWMVLDWGSVHGSFVDGKQLAKVPRLDPRWLSSVCSEPTLTWLSCSQKMQIMSAVAQRDLCCHLQNVPVELTDGSLLRFAASSRAYSLHRPALGTSVPESNADAEHRQAAPRGTGNSPLQFKAALWGG